MGRFPPNFIIKVGMTASFGNYTPPPGGQAGLRFNRQTRCVVGYKYLKLYFHFAVSYVEESCQNAEILIESIKELEKLQGENKEGNMVRFYLDSIFCFFPSNQRDASEHSRKTP